MRVLHVIPAVAPRYGGPSQAIFEMCGALRSQGHELLIATTDVDGSGRLPLRLGTEIEYRGQPTIVFRGAGERFNYSRSFARWVSSNAREFDVVHIHAVFSHPCVVSARAAGRSGVPYIIRPLGSLDPWSMQQKSFRKRLMWQLAAGRMLRKAGAVHYTADEEKRLAESSLLLERGVVIPLGVNNESEQSSSAAFLDRYHEIQDKPYILVLSRLHPKKNLEMLIDAFARLTKRQELSDWRLAIAGEGDPQYSTKLRRLAAESSARDRITFVGWLEGEIKTSAIAHASLFALPSQQENFGIAAAEAMAAGVPVIVSDRVNLAAQIADAGAGWVAPLDQDSFMKTLADAMRDDESRTFRGYAAKRFVDSNLSWEATALALSKLYSSLVSRGCAVEASVATI